MLGVQRFILGLETRNHVWIGCILQFLLNRLQPLFDRGHAGLIVFAQFATPDVIVVQACGRRMRNMLGEENANPSQCADGRDGFGSLLELPAGDVFGDRAIKPLAFPLTGEEVTFNATTGGERSEEHTSELQSLMRNSYAVFCLKKQTQ